MSRRRRSLPSTIRRLLCDVVTLVRLALTPRAQLAAENMFLRKQLHPTAEWTIQQFRAVVTPETSHRFVLHDRDSIYAASVDRAIASMGRHVLKTPARTPQAKDYASYCTSLV